MRPFNLEEAIQGKPLVTRDGRKILDFHYFKSISKSSRYPVKAILDGTSVLLEFTLDGKYVHTSEENPNDLFMYEEPKTYYVNIYREKDRRPYMGTCYESFEDVKKMAEEPINKNYIKTIEFII